MSRKDWSRILRCVSSFVDELIVIDNNSSDNTVEVVKKYAATLIQEKNKDTVMLI